ncbi:ankyrin repeat-containing protein At5g02620-like [Benincasa hispida]|uniref:ankyrin repeat-containing protein At5g02620-like n=1 Tax=Benincasa hispida TaxID=102211 RepID=UPI0018FF6D00|nr:ankyrin repeat-containing protein At5g02620-like [Benincasa hispida]
MDPQLFKAATNGDLGHLQNLTPLQKSLLPFQFSPNHNTPLHVATEFRQLDFVKAVVRDYETLLWLQNGAGDTALHVAAREALGEFVEFFIGVSPRLLRMVNFEGDTALHCAARIGSLICVEKMVEADPELCGIVNNNGESALYLAVAAAYWEVPEVIIREAKLLASYKGAKGLTALHPTLFFPNYEFKIIELLVEWRKEMIKEQDCLGLTPLHYASLYGRTKAINLFLQNESSSIYILDNNGESALHIAAFEGHKDAVEEILNCCQDSCYLVDNKGRTALHAAVLGDQRKVVRLILGRAMQGRVMNKADGDGNMALHLAAFHEFYDIIEILATDVNVDLNAKNKEFLTALDFFNKHDQEGLRAAIIRNLLEGRTGPMTMQHLAEEKIKKMNQEIKIMDDHDNSNEVGKTDGKMKKGSSYNTEKQKALEVNLLVATLVATVTFAAGFTMPGGYFENIGLSILSDKGGFRVFVIFNTIAFCCSVFAVLLHFHTSITDHYQRVRYMGIAGSFTSIAIVAMVIAFASGTHVVIANSKAFSLSPFLICGGFSFLYFAIPFCDPGVEGYSFLHTPQRFIRRKIVRYIRYEEY